jgi:hypothetical protein
MLFFDYMLCDRRSANSPSVGTPSTTWWDVHRQCLFADYELQAYRLAEQGIP